MPRFTNSVTGVTVDVPEDMVASLGAGYKPASKTVQKAPVKPQPKTDK